MDSVAVEIHRAGVTQRPLQVAQRPGARPVRFAVRRALRGGDDRPRSSAP